LVETTPQGPIPKIAANGMRPAEAYAQPIKPVPGKPDAPRVALIVGGLGVSASISNDAISKLPGAVTLAFMPYSYDVDHLAGATRFCCRRRWSRSTIRTTIPARKRF
jgi:polysaccharide deacetylase 2 family uncharacterized protein YibQ